MALSRRYQRSLVTAAQLTGWVAEARERTFELVADLTDDQLLGPRLTIVNPLRWEIGHIAWFQEKWVLRYASRQKPIRKEGDALYDSAAIPHDTRWDLPLPSREETLAYMREVRDRVLERLQNREPGDEEVYFILLSIFHEDMHAEAFTYTRQTLGYSPPQLTGLPRGARKGGPQEPTGPAERRGGPLPGDVEIPGGRFHLGATPEEPFVFDNEKWAHPVPVKSFAIARAAVT
ncbi:MAG: DinB family protein, partial [Candidatus Methylomirabilales bacterium]